MGDELSGRADEGFVGVGCGGSEGQAVTCWLGGGAGGQACRLVVLMVQTGGRAGRATEGCNDGMCNVAMGMTGETEEEQVGARAAIRQARQQQAGQGHRKRRTMGGKIMLKFEIASVGMINSAASDREMRRVPAKRATQERAGRASAGLSRPCKHAKLGNGAARHANPHKAAHDRDRAQAAQQKPSSPPAAGICSALLCAALLCAALLGTVLYTRAVRPRPRPRPCVVPRSEKLRAGRRVSSGGMTSTISPPHTGTHALT